MIHPLYYVLDEDGPQRSYHNDKYGGTWNMWDQGGHRFHLIDCDGDLRLLWDYATEPDDRWFGDTGVVIDVDEPTEMFAIEAFTMFKREGKNEEGV